MKICLAIIGVTIIMAVAGLNGIDGPLAGAGAAIIGGLGGFEVGRKTEQKKKK